MLKGFTTIGVIGLMICGCHSNPYAGMTDHVSPTPPVATKPVQTGGCEVQSKIDINEGAVQDVQIRCSVPTGNPVITFDNLPGFAAVNANGAVLHLTPQIGDAIDPSNPTETSRAYAITVDLSEDKAPVTLASQNFVVVVHHKAQTATINNFSNATIIYEGDVYQSTFTVTSADFPNGPFEVSTADLPAGVTIQSTNDPTTFTINYAPDFKTVTIDNATPGNCNFDLCSDFEWHLNVIDPRGGMATADTDWTVVDVRQYPIVEVPDHVNGTLPSADFYAQVEDPNGEVVPAVTVKQVTAGTATALTSTKGAGTPTTNPYALVDLSWTGIKANKGSVQTMTIESCVYRDVNRDQDLCTDTPVNVQF